MIDDTGDCFETDISFSDFGMAVFVATHWVKAVIKVNSAQSVKFDYLVEFVYHLIKLMFNTSVSWSSSFYHFTDFE